MLVENVELTLSHVDLGTLDELALMTLFGTAHSHRITLDTGHSIRDITDASGAPLYCGYYWTHLKVPPTRLLRRFQVWDRVAVGVDVRRFGAMLLSSTYVLGRPGEVDEHDPARWDLEGLPAMRAGNTFYRDGADNPPSSPREGCLAELPRLNESPAALARFRALRTQPSIAPGFVGRLGEHVPIPYALVSGRDLRPDRGIMFSRYAGIADAMERTFLARSVAPPVPLALADCLWLLERETFYFANLRNEHVLTGRITANLSRCAPDLHGDDKELLSVGLFEAVIEIYDDSNVLLVASTVKKLLAVPRIQANRIVQAERLMASHAS